MRTLLLERNEELKYHIPLSRSFNALSNGFLPQEIEEIRTILSGKKETPDFSTEITFDRPELLELLDRGSNDLSSAVDSVYIRTDSENDPVPKDLADTILSKINNQISLTKKVAGEPAEKQQAIKSEPTETVKLSVSENLVNMIKRFESFKANPYICPGGALTIGYGQTIKPGEYTSVTKEQADAMLRKTIAKFEAAVKKLITVPVSQNQYDAIVSFAYNVGAGKGGLKTSTLLKKLNAGDYKGAADEFPRWNKSDGKVLPGLIKRRELERNLFLS